jgi:prephenate dehydrogenase
MARLSIIGLGLIGGSLGLALKRANLSGLEIAGFDHEWGANGRARRKGAIDVEARGLAAAAEGAAVVVIATPISQVKAVFQEIAPALGEGAVVTDTASTKRDVLRWAEELLPEHVNFVGGHPIAGKETSGLDAAEAGLLQGRAWAVTPSVHASQSAIHAVENMITIAGAQPVPIDADEHDSYLAAISHLPLIASTALFSLARGSQAWSDLGLLAGPGFRDVTRLASTNPALGHDICLTNREHILHWIDRYIEELRRYRALITDEHQEELYKTLLQVQLDRDAFLQKPPERERPSSNVEVASAGERMLSFMVGDYFMRRAKDVERLASRKEPGDDTPKRGR